MKSKLEIVKELHNDHVAKHKGIVDDCMFCSRKHEESRFAIIERHEENILNIIEKHINNWHLNGALMATHHSLPDEIALGIIYKWIKAPQIEVEDSPEDYINNDIVLDIYMNQKK